MGDIYSYFLKKNGAYTEIQKIAIPIVSSGSNCLIVAPTGHGKTEAAMLPFIDLLARERRRGISLLYITPLRALNRDMIRRLETLCKEVGVSIGVRHGDTSQKERKMQTIVAPEILITTPETLQSILVNAKLRVALKGLRAMVVDELHELYHNKRGAQLSIAMERLAEIAGEYQRIGISATVGDKETLSRVLCGRRDCRIADAGISREVSLTVETPRDFSEYMKGVSERFGLDHDSIARLEAVADHISGSASALVFANTRQVVEAVGSRLVYMNSIKNFGGIGVHHSSLDRSERIRIEEEFKNRKLRGIIATSSLELGIDIGSIDAVVQYGSPRQSLRLTQRVGRSGHSIKGTPRGFIIPLNTIDMLEAAVLSERASAGSFERFSPHFSALDVLATQVCGIAVETGGIQAAKLHGIITRSFIYKDLKMGELVALLEFMTRQHMVGFGEGLVTPGRGTKLYYYKHQSVISDVRRFVVKNFAEHKIISTLDEKFVANNVDEGSVFITKGLPWKVISIDENVVTVEPSTDLEAAVPDWEGEDIPVSYDTAHAVLNLLSRGAGRVERFLDDNSKSKLLEFVKSQREYYMPSSSEVTIESFDNYHVVYTWMGSSANDALSKLISHMISKRTGREVSTRTSAYAIFIEGEERLDIADLIRQLNGGRALEMLRAEIIESELFRYKFVAVAKLFGIIERGALVSRSMTRRLIKALHGTPVYNETLRELMCNYFDTKSLGEFAAGIASGQIKIREVKTDRATPLTKALIGYSYSARELIAPITPNDEIVGIFTRSLLAKSAKLICSYCGFVFSRTLEEIKVMEKIRCGACGSPLIAMYSDNYTVVVGKRKQGKKLSKSEAEALNEMMIDAGLISSYGPRAVMALSVYGVGPRSAARALMMRKGQERDFFVDLIEAQKTFIRTKKYWSV